MYPNFRAKYSYIEITPPAFTDKTAIATESLFGALHGLGNSLSLREKLVGVRHTFTAEVVSSKTTGIRFIIGIPDQFVEVATGLVQAYLPDAKYKITEHRLQPNKILLFKFGRHYAYPIKQYDLLMEDDPIGYIANAMANLNEDEQISYKLTLTPCNVRSAKVIGKKIMKNENFMPTSRTNYMIMAGLGGVSRILFNITDMVSSTYHGETKYAVNARTKEMDYKTQVAKDIKPVRQLSYFEHEMVEATHDKLKRPLFKSSVSVLVKSDQPRKYKKAFSSVLSLYNVPERQHMKPKRSVQKITKLRDKYNLQQKSTYLGARELASLYHFPHSVAGKVDNVVKSHSKTLVAPLSLKNGTKLDVMIGVNKHHGVVTPIGLTEAERQRHMYIIGGTGNGKTTMMKYQIIQDLMAGKGVAVVDPHGDLSEELLGYVPKERIKDVIYINPIDLDMPIGINLLEMDPDESGNPKTGNDLIMEKDMITESAMSVLRKIFTEDDSGGHRIEYVLRNSIQTALTLPEANMFTIFKLLNDAKFRTSVIKGLDDKEYKDLKNFWRQELGKAGDMQRIKMAAGITAKIGRFLFSGTARAMMEQNKSTINFEDIMNEKKILICNFSKGLLGEDTSALFGITILAKLQLASLRRAKQQQDERTSYYLYVDEFQNFATMGFVQMLSEARKYKLFLTMAEQSTQQQEEQRLVDIILANVGTVVAFRSGSPKDEQLIQPLFYPFVEKGEIASLPAYNFYAKISAIQAQEPMSGETVLLNLDENKEIAQRAKDHSRNLYGHKAEPIQQHKPLRKRKKPSKKPAKVKNRNIVGEAKGATQ